MPVIKYSKKKPRGARQYFAPRDPIGANGANGPNLRYPGFNPPTFGLVRLVEEESTTASLQETSATWPTPTTDTLLTGTPVADLVNGNGNGWIGDNDDKAIRNTDPNNGPVATAGTARAIPTAQEQAPATNATAPTHKLPQDNPDQVAATKTVDTEVRRSSRIRARGSSSSVAREGPPPRATGNASSVVRQAPQSRVRGKANTLTTPSTRFPGVKYANPDSTLMNGKAWTEAEDIELLRLRGERVSYREIARAHLTRHTQRACSKRYFIMKDK